MMDKRGPRFVVLLGLLATAPLASCTPKVTYGDAGAVETVTADFGSTDLQMIAAKMVESLKEHPVINRGAPPIVLVDAVRNKTSEHIDTKSITDKIRTELLRSGKVRFPARSEAMDARMQEMELTEKGMTDQSKAKKLGKMLNVDFILTGEISSIVKNTSSRKDVYYKITLNLVDLETDEIVWADEKEIRKGEERPFFGR